GATINRKLAALSKVMGYAMRRSDVSGLKTKPHFERQPEGEGRIRFLTVKEEQELLKILNDWGKQDHADAVVVLIDTGLRGSELWKLEVRDVDLKAGTLTIWMPKNKNPRTVPMTARVKDIFTRRTKTH